MGSLDIIQKVIKQPICITHIWTNLITGCGGNDVDLSNFENKWNLKTKGKINYLSSMYAGASRVAQW